MDKVTRAHQTLLGVLVHLVPTNMEQLECVTLAAANLTRVNVCSCMIWDTTADHLTLVQVKALG